MPSSLHKGESKLNVHTPHTLFNGNPSFPVFFACFLRLQRITMTTMIAIIIKMMIRMAPTMTPMPYSAKTLHHHHYGHTNTRFSDEFDGRHRNSIGP